jgi:hypothetical protein
MPSLLYTIILLLFPVSVLPVSLGTKLYVLVFVFVTTAILPSVGIFLLYLTGSVNDITLQERKQRVFPNFFTCLIYIMVCFLFYDKLHFRGLLLNTMIGATLLVVLLSTITMFWKISLHSAGIAGIVGFLFGINVILPLDNILEIIILSLVLTGFVMSARLYLGSHKALQIWLGAFLGGLIGIIIPLYFL